jgi:hypothetical protein
LERVEELLKVKQSPSMARLPRVRKGQEKLGDGIVNLSRTWNSWPMEIRKDRSDIDSQEKNTDQCPDKPGSFRKYEDFDSMTPESEDTTSGRDILNANKKGMGSLIVNEVGDLQYLGNSGPVLPSEPY